MAQGPGRQSTVVSHRDESYQPHRTSKRSQSVERGSSSKYSTYSCERAKTPSIAPELRQGPPASDVNYLSTYGAKNTSCARDGAPEMGIKSIEMENSSVIQTVEIFKNPGQTLGFYIREGNGIDRPEGVFISRIQTGTVAESNGLLHIGDEILSVNGVEVSRMSLDDVVILMSIPRKLLLKIRSKKNSNKKNASCPSLAMTETETPPVVVLKRGHVRASSDTQIEMTEKLPNMFEHPHTTENASDYLNKRINRQDRPTSQYASIFISPHKAEAKLITDDNNSEHSSEGSIPRSIDSGSRDHYSGHRGFTAVTNPMEDPYGYLAPSSLPTYSYFPPSDSLERDRDYGCILQQRDRTIPSSQSHYQRVPSKGASFITTTRNPYYSSDSDRGAYSDSYQPLSDYGIGYRAGLADSANRQRYQGGFREMIHTKAKYGSKGQRSRSPECYNSDSEIIYTSPSGALMAADPRGFASDYETYAGAMSDDEPVYAVPKPLCTSSRSELEMLVRKFNTLSHELQQEQTRLQQQLTSTHKPVCSNEERVEGYSSDDHGSLHSSPPSSSVFATKSLSPVPNRKVATSTQTSSNAKLLRKHSADCLLTYKTYQMEDPYASVEPAAQEYRYSKPNMHSSSKGPKGPLTVTTSASIGLMTNADPGGKSIDENGRALTRTSASRFRDLQLAKRPLQVSYGDFDCYRVDLKKRNEFSRTVGFDGLLCAHVLCGQGLKCARMTLRDLYCVISVDSLNKARTMIRTGAVNFDWDEAFDIDLENAKDVSFLIYNWDPNYKHRLCFHGSIFLPGFLDPSRKKHIALKMEPKGLLYITLLFKEPKEILQRLPSTKSDGVFGVDLDTVIKRENSGLKIPLLVVKCLAEIERRGTEVVGIYRLCGSSRRKAQLREVFEKNSSTVDLSPEIVSDIHVITGVLKDYLRELPEPLVTNALYQMMLDALSVRLPSDPDGSAKLMLSILECLPKSNQGTMSMVLNHLRKMCCQCERTKMGLEQLATCLGPVLLCPSSLTTQPEALHYSKHIDVLKYLLEIWTDTCNSKASSSVTTPRSEGSDNQKVVAKPNT